MAFTQQKPLSAKPEVEAKPTATPTVDKNKPIYFGFVLLIVAIFITVNLNKDVDFNFDAMNGTIVNDGKNMDEQSCRLSRRNIMMLTCTVLRRSQQGKPGWFFQTCKSREEFKISAEKTRLVGGQMKEELKSSINRPK